MNIGFIGIGRMGRFMARNLAKGGHNLTVFDTHRDAAEELLSQVALTPDSIGGASWADSPGCRSGGKSSRLHSTATSPRCRGGSRSEIPVSSAVLRPAWHTLTLAPQIRILSTG